MTCDTAVRNHVA